MTKRIYKYLLGVAVARNNTVVDTLQEASKLPSSRTTLRVTAKTLLRHDRHSIARRSMNGREDVVPYMGLVLLLQGNNQHLSVRKRTKTYVRAGTGTVNGQYTDVVGGQTPDCECTANW